MDIRQLEYFIVLAEQKKLFPGGKVALSHPTQPDALHQKARGEP